MKLAVPAWALPSSPSRSLVAALKAILPTPSRQIEVARRRPRAGRRRGGRQARLGAAVRFRTIASADDDPTPTRPSSKAAALPAGELPKLRTPRSSARRSASTALLYTWTGQRPEGDAGRADGAPGRGAHRTRHREATGSSRRSPARSTDGYRLGPRLVGRQGQPDRRMMEAVEMLLGLRLQAAPDDLSRVRRRRGGQRRARCAADRGTCSNSAACSCEFVLDEGLLVTQGVHRRARRSPRRSSAWRRRATSMCG